MSYYLKKYWKINLAVVLFAAVLHFIQASFSLVLMQAVQALIEMDARQFVFWVVVNLAGWGIWLCVEALRKFVYSRAIRTLNNAVRRDMAATLLQKDYQTYHKQDRGEYLSWFTTGVNQIEKNAWNSFFSFAYYLMQVLANMVVLVVIHWSFLPLALLSAAIMFVVPQLFEKKLTRLGEACANGQAAAVSGLKDLLGGYDILRFFSRDARFRRGVETASSQIEQPAYEMSYKSGILQCIVGGANVFSQVIIMLYTGFLIFRNIVPVSAFFSDGTLIGAITNGLNQLAGYRMNMSTSKPYFARITVHDSGEQPPVPQELEPISAITVEHLSFQYDQKPVLQDLSLQFRKGGKYAITGPSGCGKSTLLKLLLGWLPEYGGAIRFDSRDARSCTPEQLQKQMSYIEQNVFLFNTTIRDNITLGETFTDEQMEKALRDSALAGDLALMPDGLDTAVGEEGSNLSGGQKQRVAIARALIHNCSVLLVDEGTSALDQKNADIVEKSLLANPELTLILVSHHLTDERKAQFTHVYELPAAAV